MVEERIAEVEMGLRRRGFHAMGIEYVTRLLAAEHAEGSPEREAWLQAAQRWRQVEK